MYYQIDPFQVLARAFVSLYVIDFWSQCQLRWPLKWENLPQFDNTSWDIVVESKPDPEASVAQ